MTTEEKNQLVPAWRAMEFVNGADAIELYVRLGPHAQATRRVGKLEARGILRGKLEMLVYARLETGPGRESVAHIGHDMYRADEPRMAYTAIVNSDGFSLGVAHEHVPGYSPVHPDTKFDSWEGAKAHAAQLNEELGIPAHEAALIVASSMRAQGR